MLKKIFIFTALTLGFLFLLSLWVFDKVMFLSGKEQSFHFFSPSPRPLTGLSSMEPLSVSSLGRSI